MTSITLLAFGGGVSLFLAAEHVFGSSTHRSVVYVFVVMPVARIQCRNLIAEIVNMQISSVDWLQWLAACGCVVFVYLLRRRPSDFPLF